MQNNQQDFDFSRNDKLYQLTIPTYHHIKDSVYYEVHLTDLVKNQKFIHNFRFNDLKEYNEQMMQLKLELPQFPKTHFWRKTNKNPELIKQRKVLLQKFFSVLVNDPFTRGSKSIKKFIKLCKYGQRLKRTYSDRKYTECTDNSRANSQKKGNPKVRVNARQWTK